MSSKVKLKFNSRTVANIDEGQYSCLIDAYEIASNAFMLGQGVFYSMDPVISVVCPNGNIYDFDDYVEKHFDSKGHWTGGLFKTFNIAMVLDFTEAENEETIKSRILAAIKHVDHPNILESIAYISVYGDINE